MCLNPPGCISNCLRLAGTPTEAVRRGRCPYPHNQREYATVWDVPALNKTNLSFKYSVNKIPVNEVYYWEKSF